ncbi:ATP-binding cassette domain-containing protein [Streptomyces sp. NPDC045456]|uniref:ATP-binding cassette domain-containing protein n=1 Tax=Streptomyces sp. NPDC045456 TaxID=3155254 RepID=UPI0033CDB24B
MPATAAIVGSPGSGKSTPVQLLPRFSDPAHGSVSLSGADLRALDGRELYRKIAVVFQDIHLFDGTIEENLRQGHPGADKAAMRAAAAADRLDEVVERLGGVGR